MSEGPVGMVDPRRAEAVELARVTLHVHRVLVQMACEFNPLHVRKAAYDFAKWLDAVDAQIDGNECGP